MFLKQKILSFAFLKFAFPLSNNAYTRFAEGKMTRSADAQRRGISISYMLVVRFSLFKNYNYNDSSKSKLNIFFSNRIVA